MYISMIDLNDFYNGSSNYGAAGVITNCQMAIRLNEEIFSNDNSRS